MPKHRVVTLPRLRHLPVLTVEQARVIQRERLSSTERALVGATILISLPVPAMALSIGFAIVAGWIG